MGGSPGDAEKKFRAVSGFRCEGGGINFFRRCGKVFQPESFINFEPKVPANGFSQALGAVGLEKAVFRRTNIDNERFDMSDTRLTDRQVYNPNAPGIGPLCPGFGTVAGMGFQTVCSIKKNQKSAFRQNSYTVKCLFARLHLPPGACQTEPVKTNATAEMTAAPMFLSPVVASVFFVRASMPPRRPVSRLTCCCGVEFFGPAIRMVYP